MLREREKAKVPYTWSESDVPARMRDENMRNCDCVEIGF